MEWRSSDMDHVQLLDDDLMFELHDDHLFCTNLFNRTLPLIRYRLDDRLEPLGTDRRRITRITGRVETRVWLRNVHGEATEMCSLLPANAVDEVVADARVAAAQVAIVSDDEIDCRVVLTAAGRIDETGGLHWAADRIRALLNSQDLAARDHDIARWSHAVRDELSIGFAAGDRCGPGRRHITVASMTRISVESIPGDGPSRRDTGAAPSRRSPGRSAPDGRRTRRRERGADTRRGTR
jgi:hypothetical protein